MNNFDPSQTNFSRYFCDKIVSFQLLLQMSMNIANSNFPLVELELLEILENIFFLTHIDLQISIHGILYTLKVAFWYLVENPVSTFHLFYHQYSMPM